LRAGSFSGPAWNLSSALRGVIAARADPLIPLEIAHGVELLFELRRTRRFVGIHLFKNKRRDDFQRGCLALCHFLYTSFYRVHPAVWKASPDG